MTRTRSRLLAVLIGASLAGAVSASAVRLFQPRVPTSRLDEAGAGRDELISRELAGLGEHPWAGVYRTGGPWPDVLRIAPDAGYTLYGGSYCGNCAGWDQIGRVVEAKGSELLLEIEMGYVAAEDDEWSEYRLDGMLYVIPWGDLRFAVPSRRMEAFCAAVSDAWTFPDMPFRSIESGEELDPRSLARPEGVPEVPGAYRHLVLTRPITGRVEALAEWRVPKPKKDGVLALCRAVLSLDAGAEDGVAVGMRFYLLEPEYLRSGRVESVGAGSCRVVFTAREDDREVIEALVGSPASTLHPMRGQEER